MRLLGWIVPAVIGVRFEHIEHNDSHKQDTFNDIEFDLGPTVQVGARSPVLAARRSPRIMPAVIDLDPSDRAMLEDALKRARTLVQHLEERKRELDQSPPSIDAEKLAEGRHAMIKAVASARRMLAALEDAERIADTPEA